MTPFYVVFSKALVKDMQIIWYISKWKSCCLMLRPLMSSSNPPLVIPVITQYFAPTRSTDTFMEFGVFHEGLLKVSLQRPGTVKYWILATMSFYATKLYATKMGDINICHRDWKHGRIPSINSTIINIKKQKSFHLTTSWTCCRAKYIWLM